MPADRTATTAARRLDTIPATRSPGARWLELGPWTAAALKGSTA
jgi:hypothetical protein